LCHASPSGNFDQKKAMLQDITKLVSLILGISVSSDRLITLIKSLFPQLAAPAGSAAPGPPTGDERKNRVILIITSFICCLATTVLISLSGLKFPLSDESWNPILIGIIALMATGGSAFWTNILGYLSALKDVTNVKALKGQADFEASQKDREQDFTPSHEKRTRNNDLKTVTFVAAFSGGVGSLFIDFQATGDSLEFDGDGTQTLQLPLGEINFTVSGNASPGPGGGAVLTITGTQVVKPPIKFGPSRIPVKTYSLIV